jgi:hypothetical protein
VFSVPEVRPAEPSAKLDELQGGRFAPNERFAPKERFAANELRGDEFEKLEAVRDERDAKLAWLHGGRLGLNEEPARLDIPAKPR